MIDLKALRSDPERFRKGAADKNYDCDIDALLTADTALRAALTEHQELLASKNRISKLMGQKIGQAKQLEGKLNKARAAGIDPKSDEFKSLVSQVDEVQVLAKGFQQEAEQLKEQEQDLDGRVKELAAIRDRQWLTVPQPADTDVPVGKSADDNIPLRTWHPANGFDPRKTFEDNKGFAPKSHMELGQQLGLFDFERGVKMAGSRSYILTGDGMRLHNAVLQFAFNYMTGTHGFKAMSVPVMVREELMVGTGFFPGGRDQAYHIEETKRGGGHDMFLTGTGEVGLMGVHQNEILEEQDLPKCYTTVSTCFRREAGSAGKDTAGLYRIHQFDKVEQVVVCKADEQESRDWHAKMIGYVEEILKQLELPYRLLQCCTGDLGMKNADMIDVECWMPSRAAPGKTAADDDHIKGGNASGGWGETHSASRLYDYQTRRLNLRYRTVDEQGKKQTVFCHSLNNTVAASPRLLIPLIEVHQNADGSITIPKALRPYLGGQEKIG
ncbi:MAG: serine--tRNA ligase [Phycisphaerales bacterium JB063]